MVRIRPVDQRDADRWLALRCALWQEGSSEEHREEIARFFAGKAQEPQAVLIAEKDGQPVGIAELSIRAYAEGCVTDRVAYLEGWYVAPEFRGLGYGRALIAAAEEWGAAQGCKEFASDAELDNHSSKAAHEACGFVEVGAVRCFRKALGAG
jgi:aminoglycoside 6'-N-acetyltransferase I